MKKMLKIVFALSLVFVMTFSFAACSDKENYTAVIDIENYGKITLTLDADAAPKTVANFVKLAWKVL